MELQQLLHLRFFQNLNSSLTLFNEKPDGEKVNVGCGSTNPEFLSRKIKEDGFDLGFHLMETEIES